MPTINNVTRMLDAHKIPFQVFDLPPEKLSALETARLLEVESTSVYKTIVVTRKHPRAKPILAVIPGTSRLDLKALAAFLGDKKVVLPTEREAERLTGLQAGGISPLALINKGYQVIIDASAESQSEIHISGGQRGINIRMPVAALIELTRARVARIGGE